MGEPVQIRYENVDGFSIFQGDIVLGRAGTIARTRDELIGSGDRPVFGVGIDGTRWGSGTVPYVIGQGFNSAQTQGILDGIAMVNNALAGVNVKPRTGEGNYVVFQPSASLCNSFIGYQGGSQTINLIPAGCADVPGKVAHEILHALGVGHEQSRCDRDGYAQINWTNILPNKEHNFETLCDGFTDLFGYSETSIMHYRTDAFSNGNGPTITSLRGLGHLMGNRDSLDLSDRNTMNYMYEPYPVSGGVTYPSGVPTVSWTNRIPYATYTVKYIVYRVEYSVSTGQASEYMVNEFNLATEVSAGPVTDPYFTHTGVSYCTAYEDQNGSVSYYWYYELIPSYPYPITTPPPSRFPAEVGSC